MEILNKIITVDKHESIGLCGMTDEFFCAYVNKLFLSSKRDILVLTPSAYEANKIYSSLVNYNKSVLLFPMDEFLTSESIAISPELKTIRLDTLRALNNKDKHIVVVHLESFLRFLPTKKDYNKSLIKINRGSIFKREDLIKQLFKLGYKKETIVTNTGELGIRGFIIDVFPINFDNPIRIEFFDDEIESIRIFDEVSQKSIRFIDEILIYPNTEFIVNEELEGELAQKYLPQYMENVSNILNYLNNPITIIKDYSQIKAVYKKLTEDIFEYRNLKDFDFAGQYMHNLESFDFNNSIYYSSVDDNFETIEKGNIFHFGVKSVPQFKENVLEINDYIEAKLNFGYTIIICLKKHQINSFVSYLKHKYIITDDKNIYDNKINIVENEMQEGFIYGKYVFITSNELFNKKTDLRLRSRFKYTSKIKSLSSLEIGDYVVHSVNGIGVYNGLKTLTKNELKKDYLEILYAGSDKLYIPVEKIELIGKYTGKEGVSPKINRLGSTEWEKTKLRVRNKVHDIAKKLLELYARRKLRGGYEFEKDDELQLMFESEFQYDETPDQLRAINQIKNDMEKPEAMDRLLCGDVGYGKTEVAFRAMFKAVNNSKQVMYLCPTTILSKQQFENAKLRFANFPIKIALVNRFTSQKEYETIINDINEGKIDILFGTHKLLNDSIKPNRLGLLVIDEEQRFGVVHKEKIKEYKENVDVLTLTATPIPRTLQMSLVGIRGLSLIETPPVDRYPIQTYVIEENKALIKDAIYKEMARRGQIFVLYNNVSRIEEKALEIQRLVPEARVIYAHGQLSKVELEDRMLSFINYDYDVMVCTTIIETGIDIPNVNTLIIYNADCFGLSQLYQIRGRVGRGNRLAYAYLMYSPNKVLNETAVKRLSAIKEFTELGSGFAIASRDLAIRGAGDILGSEQAGFIDSIGIDLYLKILNEEIDRLNGKTPEDKLPSRVNNLLEIDTHIDNNYVSDEELKIEIHQLINKVTSYEELQEVKTELEDRFGRLDDNLVIYLYEEWFESMADKLHIIKVNQNNRFIELIFDKEISDKVDGEHLFSSAIRLSRNFNFKYQNNNLRVVLDISNLDKHYIFYLTSLLKDIKIDNSSE